MNLKKLNLEKKHSPVIYLTDQPDELYENVDTLNYKNIDTSSLARYQAFIIKDDENLLENLGKIRRDNNTKVYLKPVYVKIDPKVNPDKYTMELIDGVLHSEEVFRFFLNHRHVIESINTKIDEISLSDFEDQKKYGNPGLKVLRYMFTRDIVLKPVLTTDSVFGYTYPNISIYLSPDDYQEFRLLEFLENRYLLDGKFIDRIHSCNYCYSSFLNFREICPSCESPNLKVEDLVHHFLCANIGPESDYQQNGENICPKCRKKLKHIGVDFDRPSLIYSCNICEHQFQEPDVDILCVQCGKKSIPENSIIKTIKEYNLTTLGRSSAIFGIVVSLKESLNVNLEILDLDIFKIMLNLEVERISRYGLSQSSAGICSIDNYMEILTRLGKKAREINREISSAIKNTLRNSDVISYLSDSVLIFLFTETKVEKSKIALKRLTDNIKILIHQNIGMDAVIKTQCFEIDGQLSPEKIIEKLKNHV